MNRHVIDDKTLMCSCGKPKEYHLNVELVSEKVKMRWQSGDFDLDRDFAEIEAAIHPL